MCFCGRFHVLVCLFVCVWCVFCVCVCLCGRGFVCFLEDVNIDGGFYFYFALKACQQCSTSGNIYLPHSPQN